MCPEPPLGQALVGVASGVVAAIPRGRIYQPHFTGWETETGRGEVTCSRSHCWSMNPGFFSFIQKIFIWMLMVLGPCRALGNHGGQAGTVLILMGLSHSARGD